jgi:hypothetical protein
MMLVIKARAIGDSHRNAETIRGEAQIGDFGERIGEISRLFISGSW